MAPRKIYKFHFYCDEGFPQPVCEYLRKCGHLVVTVKQAKRAGIGLSDIKQLEFARKMQALFITLDQDFIRVDNARLRNHPGIIVIETADPSSKRIKQILQFHLKNINSKYCYQKIIKLTINQIKLIKSYQI